MKYTLIKETDKIKLISGKDTVCYSGFDEPVKKGETYIPAPDVIEEREIVKTKIFTDGEIKGIASLDSSLSDLPKKFSKIEIDKTELSELELSDHNYVIRILTVLEFLKFGSVSGWYDVIRNVDIYLRDKKDKESIKNIKKTLSLINSSPIFDDLFKKKYEKINTYEQVNENVYQLQKRK